MNYKIDKNIPIPTDYKKVNNHFSHLAPLADKIKPGESVVMYEEKDIHGFRIVMALRGKNIMRRRIKDGGQLRFRVWCI